MNKLEIDLIELLKKYDLNVKKIYILFTGTGKDILEIIIEDMEAKNGRTKFRDNICS